MKSMLKYSFIVIGFLFVSGCAPVISKEVMRQIQPPVEFAAAFDHPDTYRGRGALWGGVVISAKNLKAGTLIEVLQKPLGFNKRPADTDTSGGRFLALYDGYLDTAIYTRDREVTVAGIITGKRTGTLDEISYQYPVLAVKEIYLWENEPQHQTLIYPYPYLYPYPYHGRYHYWFFDPYW